MATIEEYNKYLIDNNKNVSIVDYIKYVAENIYNIDISFMDRLLELMVKNKICIHHKYLIEFGIVGNNTSGHINRIIQNNNFIENEDFRLSQVGQSKSGGCTHKNEYYFHPDAFGIMLIRSKNKKEYARYYSLCQRCIKSHSDYQLELKQSEVFRMINELKESNNELKKSNNELKKSNEKLDESNKRNARLETKLDESNIRNTRLENKLDESNARNERLEIKLDEANKKLNELQYDNITLNNKVDILDAKVDIATDTRVLYTQSTADSELFVLFKNDKINNYYVSRITKQSYSKTVRKLNEKNYSEIFKLTNIPNSVNIYKHFKDNHKNQFRFNQNNFIITDENINDDKIIKYLKLIYDKRKSV